MIKLSPQQKTALIKTYPELAAYFASMDTNALLERMAKKAEDENLKETVIIKTLKGEKGDNPSKDELISLIKPLIPSPLKGEKGDKGESVMGPRGRDGKDGRDGEDGQPGQMPTIDYTSIVEVLHGPLKASLLKEIPKMEDIRAYLTSSKSKGRLKGKELDMTDLRWHGGGISSVVHDTTLTGNGTTSSPLSVVGGVSSGFQIPTGAVNGVNLIYVYAVAPNAIVVDGATLQKTDQSGNHNWSGTTTITLLIAPTISTFAVA